MSTLSRPSSKSIAWRGFHQARIWRAEEEQKGNIAKESGASPAEDANTAATVTAERSAAEQQAEITEKSIATPGAADAAPRESTTEAITEKAADIAAETAEKAEEVAAETTENFSQAARSGADAIEEAADAAPQESAAEAITEKAEEVAAETTQNFSQAARTGAEAAAAASTSPPRRPQHDTRSTHRNPRPSRIVYVGNLFFEVTAQQLQAEFASHGSVINSRIVTDSRGLSKGFGYIEFAEQEAADAAVRALDQKVLQGRRMAVQYHVQRQPGAKRDGMQRGRNQSSAEPSKTLFIGNMSYQMSDRDLNGTSNSNPPVHYPLALTQEQTSSARSATSSTCASPLTAAPANPEVSRTLTSSTCPPPSVPRSIWRRRSFTAGSCGLIIRGVLTTTEIRCGSGLFWRDHVVIDGESIRVALA